MYLVRPSYLIKLLFPKALWRSDTSDKIIYLTFDDGPVQEETNFVLNVLKEKNIKATFFCVGENIEKNPDVFHRILNDGHAIGNHTFNHLNGWNTPTDQYLDNVVRCSKILDDLMPPDKVSSKKLFRPPYGKLKRSQSVQLKTSYSIVMWDVLSGDFDKNTSPEKCLENVSSNFRNGSVIVFHDSAKASRNMKFALPRFIDLALKKGYEFSLLN